MAAESGATTLATTAPRCGGGECEEAGDAERLDAGDHSRGHRAGHETAHREPDDVESVVLAARGGEGEGDGAGGAGDAGCEGDGDGEEVRGLRLQERTQTGCDRGDQNLGGAVAADHQERAFESLRGLVESVAGLVEGGFVRGKVWVLYILHLGFG